MYSLSKKTLFILTLFNLYSAIAAETPACVDEKKAMRFRIDISLKNRTRLVACKSAEGTQVFTTTLDKDLKPLFTTVLEASPWEEVEIYRPLDTEKTLLTLVWFADLPKGGRIKIGKKDISCKESQCSVSTSKCPLPEETRKKFKAWLANAPQGSGVEAEEAREESAGLMAALKTFQCL